MRSNDLLIKALRCLANSHRTQGLEALEELLEFLQKGGALPVSLALELLQQVPEVESRLDDEFELFDCVACQLPTMSLRTREEYVALEIHVKKWLGSLETKEFPVPVCSDCWGSNA